MANKIKNSKEINNDKDGNYIININETKLTNKVMKQNECLKKNINELLKDYNKVRIYFRENNLVSQETDAKQKIALLEKMKNDMNIGQPVDIKNLPNKISPEYIYGCSVEQRNDIFNQIINGLKKKREQYKTQNIKNLKDLNYFDLIVKNLFWSIVVIAAVAGIYYIVSMIMKKNANYFRLASITAVAFVPVYAAGFVSIIVAYIYAPLSAFLVFAACLYSFLIFIHAIDNEVEFKDADFKVFFHTICLTVVFIVAYYVLSNSIGSMTSLNSLLK